jgi:hypothetical protein
MISYNVTLSSTPSSSTGLPCRVSGRNFIQLPNSSRYRKYKESAHMAIQSANSVWTFLLSGSPSSAVRFLTHRENQYDVTDSSRVSIRFQSRVFRFYSTDGASDRYYMSSIFPPIFSVHCCSCTWF